MFTVAKCTMEAQRDATTGSERNARGQGRELDACRLAIFGHIVGTSSHAYGQLLDGVMTVKQNKRNAQNKSMLSEGQWCQKLKG